MSAVLTGLRSSGGGPAVAALLRIAEQLRGDLLNRWMALAQKRALIWWRNRRVCPGLRARFTVAGAAYYGFTSRERKPSSLMPYYHISGALEKALMLRKPKTKQAKRNGGNVVTRLAYGGHALNLMATTSKPDMRGIVGYSRTSRTITESFHVASHIRKDSSGAASVTVSGYDMVRHRDVSRSVPVRGGETHAALFGKFVRDRPAIEARVLVEFRKIVRAQAIDKRTGQIKSSALSEGGEAA